MSNCSKEMSFEECELTIIRNAVDEAEKRNSKEIINNFKQWVKMGMPDPRYKHENRQLELRQARQFWAFKKVQRPPVTKYDGDVIDGIINDELSAKDLHAVDLADEYIIIRRLYYDLILSLIHI